MKTLIILSFLFGGMGVVWSQTSDENRLKSKALLYVYLSQDSAKIYPNWQLEKGEVLRLSHLLSMQNDVFGKTTLPKGYAYSETRSISEKFTKTSIELDSIFIDHPSARLLLETYKGKKRKSRLKIEDVQVKTNDSNPFLDSLCRPYLELIAQKEIDSLMSTVFQKVKLRQALHSLEENGSKKEIENARQAIVTLEAMTELVKETLEAIDHTVEPIFSEAQLTIKKNIPQLKVVYRFPEENKERLCTFFFRKNGNFYQLTTVGGAVRGDRFDDF